MLRLLLNSTVRSLQYPLTNSQFKKYIHEAENLGFFDLVEELGRYNQYMNDDDFTDLESAVDNILKNMEDDFSFDQLRFKHKLSIPVVKKRLIRILINSEKHLTRSSIHEALTDRRWLYPCDDE